MSEFMQFYLTGGNSFVIMILAALIFSILTAVFSCKDRFILAFSSFAILVSFIVCTFAIIGSSHYEVVSHSDWQQIYQSKTKISSIEMNFDDERFSQSLNKTIDNDTIDLIKRYQTITDQDLVSGKIIVSDGLRKDERKVYLSRDNRIPKKRSKDSVLIEKIEYRKIDGIKRRFGSFSGHLEESDETGEIRITYKDGSLDIFKD